MFYTDRQLAIMEFIRDYRAARGVSPTLEEMAQQFGVSRVTIHDHVRQLEKKGAVRKVPHLARSLEIVDAEFSGDPSPAEQDALSLEVRGRIAAGEGIEAIENPDCVDLGDLLPHGDAGADRYALEVTGDSMIDDGVHDGDWVIVERRSTARDGEMVVAILEGEEATLKRFYREQPNGQQHIRLQPANPRMDPIIVDQVEIRGVVIGVIRKYR